MDNVVSAIMGPIWRGLSAENLVSVQAGKEPINIICQQFRDVYLIAGGTGDQYHYLFYVCQGKESRKAQGAKLSGPTAMFTILMNRLFLVYLANLNPIMMIPFVIVPIVYVCYDISGNEFRSCTIITGD